MSNELPLLRVSLGAMLRRIRHSQRRTLADVARAARVSVQYLSELERGHKEASSEVLAAICAALGMELHEVLVAISRELLANRARPTGSVITPATNTPDAVCLAA